MVETYGSRSSSRRVPRKVIQEMKQNMQKVPYIQMKSTIYHEQEKKDIENILDDISEPTPIISSEQSLDNVTKNPYIQWIKKILKQRGFISQP